MLQPSEVGTPCFGRRLIDFFDGWSARSAAWGSCTGGSSTARETTGWYSASSLVELGHDWHAGLLQLLQLVFKFVLLGQLEAIKANIC